MGDNCSAEELSTVTYGVQSEFISRTSSNVFVEVMDFPLVHMLNLTSYLGLRLIRLIDAWMKLSKKEHEQDIPGLRMRTTLVWNRRTGAEEEHLSLASACSHNSSSQQGRQGDADHRSSTGGLSSHCSSSVGHKVDGLTNDEVKSHLQKYRLHTRRAPNTSSQAN